MRSARSFSTSASASLCTRSAALRKRTTKISPALHQVRRAAQMGNQRQPWAPLNPGRVGRPRLDNLPYPTQQKHKKLWLQLLALVKYSHALLHKLLSGRQHALHVSADCACHATAPWRRAACGAGSMQAQLTFKACHKYTKPHIIKQRVQSGLHGHLGRKGPMQHGGPN
jgi:hypothetical protein